uniref:CARD domain-containing protein n=1 Tax=Lates calcarifer TaxID=8187 RepID=A0A4W6FLM6_LATCA
FPEKMLQQKKVGHFILSESVLDQLLDNLLERGVVNDEEMQSVRAKIRADKARDLIDTVRRKGTEASSVLIDALCRVDPCISRWTLILKVIHSSLEKRPHTVTQQNFHSL